MLRLGQNSMSITPTANCFLLLRLFAYRAARPMGYGEDEARFFGYLRLLLNAIFKARASARWASTASIRRSSFPGFKTDDGQDPAAHDFFEVLANTEPITCLTSWLPHFGHLTRFERSCSSKVCVSVNVRRHFSH